MLRDKHKNQEYFERRVTRLQNRLREDIEMTDEIAEKYLLFHYQDLVLNNEELVKLSYSIGASKEEIFPYYQGILSYLKLIASEGVPFDLDKELGIIVPYRHQITMVRSLLQTSAYPVLANVTIDTVERFQGSEKNIIIYGFTVSRPSQLSFLCDSQFIDQQGLLIDRKLNVALTRARERTLLVGNPEILESVPLFAKLIAEVPRGDIGKLKT